MKDQKVTSPQLSGAVALALLTDSYNAWLEANKLPKVSADELSGQVQLDSGQQLYVANFIDQWELAERASVLEHELEGKLATLREDFHRELTALGAVIPTPGASPRTVSTSFTLSDSFLGYVMCSAFEGGTGYWARLEDIQYGPGAKTKASTDEPFYISAYAVDTDWDDSDKTGEPAFPRTLVDFDLLARGIGLILGSKPATAEFWPNSDIVGYVQRAVAEDDAGHIDGDAADAIMQLGMFGQLVFG